MRITALVFILFFTGDLSTQAQLSKKDSLLAQLKYAKEDTFAVKLYIDIGNLYIGSDHAEARKFYKAALETSKKLNFLDGIFKSLTYYSEVFVVSGEVDSLLHYGKEALAIARRTKDSLTIGIALVNVGIAYARIPDFEMAVQYYLEGQKIAEGKAYNTIEVQINDKLQVLYSGMGQPDKAIPFGEKALQQARQLQMPELLTEILNNLALTYITKGLTGKARPLLTEALAIAKQLGNKSYELGIMFQLTDLSLLDADYGKAKSYTAQTLQIARELAAPEREAVALRNLAVCHLLTKELAPARQYAQEALAICEKNNFLFELSNVQRAISYIDVAAGNMPSGYSNYMKSETTLQEIIKTILSDKSAVLEKRYETEKKETKIKQLEAEQKLHKLSIRQKNTLNYVLAGGAAAILIIALLVYRNYKNKQSLQQQRINELEKEKQLSATEAVLKGEEQERTRLAKDLHDGLGGMMSGIKYSLQTMKKNLIMTPDNQQAFERSIDMLDSSIKEMRRVAHNMMPEALVKFGLDTALVDFCNDINQSGALKVEYRSIGLENEKIEQTMAITIYRVVQELVNNIMKHAAATTAIVQVSKNNQTLAVTVEDDGKGFDTALLQQSKGIGWSNIQNRVEFLKGKLDVQSELGKGTSVLIEINV